MNRRNFRLFGAITLILACVFLSSCGRRQPVDDGVSKIALLAAAPSHGEGHHDWDQDAEFIKQCLLEAPNVGDLTIEIHNNGWPANPRDLDDADAIVFLTDGRDMHPLKEPGRVAKIDKLAKKGAGLMFVHYSVDPPEGAGPKLLHWIGGCYEKGLSQNPINTVKVSTVENEHPVSRGCGGYILEDEWYFDLRFREDGPAVTPIMTGKLPPRNPEDKVLAWATERKDGGRGFGFTGGHYHSNWHSEAFRKLVLNAILWTAKVEVPAGGVASAKTWKFVSIPDFVNVDLTYPQPGWEDTLDYVLTAVKAENPEFVMVAGDLVMGRWPDKDSIKKHAEIYYSAWVKRMQDHGLKYYTAIGDHEIGDNPWHGEKAALVGYFKRQFQRYLKMPLNGPLRMRGTAFYWVHENTLFVSLDVFEKGEGPQGGIVPKVTGDQLKWFEETITAHSGVENVVVMAHTPILGPVKKESSSGLMLEGGADSPLWQAMNKLGVDLYLCGEVHAITCTRKDDILQIAHGGLFGYNPKINYLVGTVSGDKIELQLKEIEIINSGEKLVQIGNNRPQENVTIADEVKQKGFTTVSTATLDKSGAAKTLLDPTGSF
ncbi:MAG: ThuA domain-containing protein, partial [Planctomycetota bacterium]